MDMKITALTADLGHMMGIERDAGMARLSDLTVARGRFAQDAMRAPDDDTHAPGSTRNRQQPQPQLPPPPPQQQQQQPSPSA